MAKSTILPKSTLNSIKKYKILEVWGHCFTEKCRKEIARGLPKNTILYGLQHNMKSKVKCQISLS